MPNTIDQCVSHGRDDFRGLNIHAIPSGWLVKHARMCPKALSGFKVVFLSLGRRRLHFRPRFWTQVWAADFEDDPGAMVSLRRLVPPQLESSRGTVDGQNPA